MWVRFTAPFDWKPKRSVTLAFSTGNVVNVTRACGEAAIKAHAAVEYRKASKDSEPEPHEALGVTRQTGE
jgi:hypothetical protein